MSGDVRGGIPGEYVECKTGNQCTCTHERCGYVPWSAAYDETRDVEALAGLDRWRTGADSKIFVLQEHQLLAWLAERDAEVEARVLRHAATVIRDQAVLRFEAHGPHDARGAALWDAASHIHPDDGDAARGGAR